MHTIRMDAERFVIINIYNINASRIRPELMKRIVNI